MMQPPSWYDSSRCGTLRLPELDLAARDGAEFARQHKLKPGRRSGGVILSVIDAQIDFIHPEGALSVPGAVDDTDRLCRFIFGNVDKLDHVVASLDTHYLYQPFHRFNWVAGPNPTVRMDGTPYSTNDHPDPFTIITKDGVDKGVWQPVRFPAEMMQMLRDLEDTHKKQLCIWPVHCMLGSPGHAFDPAFAEAMVFHARARQNQYDATTKGMAQLSEHYGILQAEVQFSKDPNTQLNTGILDKWANAARIYFAGQARTHCVLETLNQAVTLLGQRGGSDLLQRLFVLEDCMSNVPDVTDPKTGAVIAPFGKWADDRFAELKAIGVNFVKSTDPVDI